MAGIPHHLSLFISLISISFKAPLFPLKMVMIFPPIRESRFIWGYFLFSTVLVPIIPHFGFSLYVGDTKYESVLSFSDSVFFNADAAAGPKGGK